MTHQGFIGSLGTSVLLVSSAVAILLIVGAIVAFEGFPGPSVDDSTRPFTVRGVGARPEPELVVPPARGRGGAATAAGTAVAPLDTATAAEIADPPAPRPPEPPPPDRPETPRRGDPRPSASGSGGPSGDGGLVATLRETVRDATRALRSTLDQLLPGSGPTLDLRRPG
jgi:hypothetical protein